MDDPKPEVISEESKSSPYYTEDPFSYNFIALQKSKAFDKPLPDAQTLIADPTYNAVGKALGVDNTKEWNQFYDKVFRITEWAKERTSGDKDAILSWIIDALKQAPSVTSRKIDDLYVKMKVSV